MTIPFVMTFEGVSLELIDEARLAGFVSAKQKYRAVPPTVWRLEKTKASPKAGFR